jgi:general secretion pathway protein A
VALRRLDDEYAVVVGPLDAEELQLAPVELAQQWIGRAVVVWRQFEAGPELLGLGDQGLPVLWLQRSLAELGYFGEKPSGFFGTATLEGVRALQQRHALVPDGAAGPRTQMVLYDLLARYPLPRLVERGSSG